MHSSIEPYATLLKPESFREMPWRNGKGVTQEIAIDPPGATLSEPEFLWRLSTAILPEPGAFSLFPGYARWIAPVEGGALRLQGPAGAVLLEIGDAYCFSGSDEVSADLPSGPVRDLGLIYRSQHLEAKMQWFAVADRVRSFRLIAETVFFYAASGRCHVSCYPDELKFALAAGEALRLDEAPSERIVLFEPLETASILAVEISWKNPECKV